MLLIQYIALPHLEVFLKRFESKRTVQAYRSDLEGFKEYLSRARVDGIQGINILAAIEYKSALVKKYSKGSCNRKLSSVKSYLAFLVRLGELRANPFDAVELYKNADYEPTPGLSNDEAMAILEASKENHLHSAVLHTLFFLGLRRSEVCALKVQDLGSDSGVPTLSVLGKGGKRRVLPIPWPVFDAIKLYLSSRARSIRDVDEPLFTVASKNSVAASSLSHNTILNWMKKYAIKAGIAKNVSPHMARVTMVSNSLENGASLQSVQHLGGWANLNMVLKYDRRRQELRNSAVWKVRYEK